MGRIIVDTFRRKTDYTGPSYAGDAGAIWIAMLTSLARSVCTNEQREALDEALLPITEDMSPKGFIASGNRKPVRLAIASVMGQSWVDTNDWETTIPGQRNH
jgi:hypothetical protein